MDTNNNNRHHSTTNTNKNLSMSDDDFQTPQRSPFQPEHFPSSPPSNPNPNSKAIIPVTNYYTSTHQKSLPPPPIVSYNRSVREDPVTGVAKVNNGGGGGEEGNGEKRGWRRRVKKEVMVDRVGLGFRVLELVLCLIAFSVMASDKTQGWSGDSFDRYKEYRYVVAVNAIGFAYAAFQAVAMTYQIMNGTHIISNSLRPLFDFLIDQILAYLLISASSSAATRVDDWVSNWGKDDFTQMATASIGMSFLAFFAFALSALISGYNLCNQKSL